MKFQEVWEIMEESFPPNERRSYINQKELLKNPIYSIDLIKNQSGTTIGFVAKWQTNNFTFLEHVAIKKEFRGGGIGSKAISQYLNDKNIILEVELPTDHISTRRIELYKRLGLKLNTFTYFQPPLNPDDDKTYMHIMSYPNKLTEEESITFINQLYKDIYNYNVETTKENND